MKIPFFTQDVQTFFKSKTNIVAIATIALGVIGYSQGLMSFAAMSGAITGGLGMITLRDGIAKQ